MAFSRLAKVATAATSVTLALLLIVHAWYWRVGVTLVEDKIAEWSDDVRKRGGRVAIEGLAVGGYPLRFDVRAASVLVEAAGPPLAWSWRGGAVRAQARVWEPGVVAVRLSGGHEWRVKDRGGASRTAARADSLTAGFEVADSELKSLKVTLRDVVASRDGLAGPVTAKSVDVSGARERGAEAGGAFRLTGGVRRAELPLAPSISLGAVVDRLTWDLVVAPLPASAGAEGLAAWRDDGGKVDVDSLALRWGALVADAEGTLSLDRRFRPLAAVTATVRGHRALIDSLVQAGRIGAVKGAAAKIALGVLLDPAGDGGIVVPLNAQDGWLTAGRWRVLRLPPVVSPPGA